MEKTFVQLAGELFGNCWIQIRTSPEKASYLVQGIPMGFASALRLKMADTLQPEVSIDCKYVEIKLTCSKRGGSVTFLPSVTLTPEGERVICQDDWRINTEEMLDLQSAIQNDNVLLNAVRMTVAGHKLADDGSWVSAELQNADGNSISGLEFSGNLDTEVATAIGMYVSMLLELLVNHKECEVALPLFATFVVKPKSKNWVLVADVDSAFSSECKNDTLGIKMLSVIPD